MKLKKAKIVIITSTKGSLLKELLNENIKNRIFEVVSDRNCEAIKFAKSQNIKTVVEHHHPPTPPLVSWIGCLQNSAIAHGIGHGSWDGCGALPTLAGS